jgi:hypothetical protein
MLANDSNDLLSIRTLSALNIFYTGDFERGRWEQLYRLETHCLEVIVFAAMWLEIAGSPDRYEFSEFVRATGTMTGVKPLLQEVRQYGGKLPAEWSRDVAESLSID